MRTRLSLALSLSTAALILSACASYDENPNYEFSSRYEGASASVPGTMPVESTQVVYETQTVAPVQSVNVVMDSAQPITVRMEAAPTDADYAGQDVSGTPGYMITLDQPIEITTASGQSYITETTPDQTHFVQGQPTHTTLAQPVDYDYSQNLIVADMPMATPDIASEIRILPSAGNAYVVQPGDTVYGLSRRNCVGIDVIRSMNGIGADYNINIGQTIQMPDSRC